MIQRDIYKEETKGMFPVKVFNEQYWRTEDYHIGGKLIRYSWTKNVCDKTITMVDNEWVHKYDMGEH